MSETPQFNPAFYNRLPFFSYVEHKPSSVYHDIFSPAGGLKGRYLYIQREVVNDFIEFQEIEVYSCF